MNQNAKKHNKITLAVWLALAFLFRLTFGLCANFVSGSDEQQVYLIGLKFYTSGAWPYFGPDVSSTIQIPGALQGLIVGLPFKLFAVPEAPFILLNLLSFASLCLFAWYCCRRLPEIPAWFVWTWLFIAPWTICLSTQITNPSYVLPGAIVFFVGAIETYPFLAQRLIPLRRANFMMGFGLCWIMQFHLSWVILIPYVALSLFLQFKKGGRQAGSRASWIVVGAALPASLLIPTFIKYGLRQGSGSTSEALQFNSDNLWRHLNFVEGILGRFLSFATFELPRFIGRNMGERLGFLQEHRWLIPFVLLLTVVGVLQCIALLLLWLRKEHSQKDWRAIKYFTAATVLLLYVSFLFSMKAPVSHTFYLTVPVAMLYSFYCWNDFLKGPFWRRFAVLFLACSIIFEAGLALHNYRHGSFLKNRALINEALRSNDYRLLGERRPGSRY